jgi:hypothetical protein
MAAHEKPFSADFGHDEKYLLAIFLCKKSKDVKSKRSLK